MSSMIANHQIRTLASKRIAILIPCYNEELTIAEVVTDFRAELPQAEIYVFDNNSTESNR